MRGTICRRSPECRYSFRCECPGGSGGVVEGRITDSNGPVAGAAVMIRDKAGAVISGIDGEYKLT